MKKSLLLLMLFVMFIGCSKNSFEPSFKSNENSLIILDTKFSNMKEFTKNDENIDIGKIDSAFQAILNISKKHYVSSKNNDEFIIYKTQSINSNMNFQFKLDNQLKFYDMCQESKSNNYLFLSCSGKYLNESLSINRIIKITDGKMETLELSKDFYNILKSKLLTGLSVENKNHKWKENKRLTIYKGLGETSTAHKECPAKLYLTVFKDFSSNINPYALSYENNNIEPFHITEFNILNNNKNYLEGKYRRYMSKELQCRGTFKIIEFTDY